MHGPETALSYAYRLHWFAARRQLVYDGDVKVSVQGHSQRARDRGGRHHEYMRRRAVLRPQPGPLVYSEAVLLVDYGQPEILEDDIVLKQGVGAHDDAYAAVLEA